MRYTANAPCTADFVSAMLCVADPLVHASGTVGACYTFGVKTAHRNDGEIDFTIGSAIAEGNGFYRVRIADTDDANLRAFSGVIELIGVVAEGASVLAAAQVVVEDDSQDLSSLVIVLVVVLAIVSIAMSCIVVILFSIVVCICVRRCKGTAENDKRDGVVFSPGGIEMAATNPLAVAKLAALRIEREAASEAREARAATMLQLHSDSDAASARQARRTERRVKKKERLKISNEAIFSTGSGGASSVTANRTVSRIV